MTIRVLVRKKPDREPLLLYYLDPFTNREVSRSAGTSDRREAERAAALWEQELLGYRGPANDGWNFFRDRFRDEHLATLAPRSQASSKTALNHYQRLMNPQALSEVTAAAVSVFQSKLLAEGRPLSSVRNYLTHLRAALRWAEHIEFIAKAPRIKLPRMAQRTFMRGRPVTEAEHGKMLKACPCPKLRRMIELLWLSGLRLGEAMRLSWDQPPIVLTLDAKPFPQILYYAEGHKARRDDAVPITPELAAWLAKTPPRARKGLVAPLDTKHQRAVSEAIQDAGRAAGVIVSDDGKAASAHDLRRGFASRLAQRVMPMTLQKLMRHADITTTLKFYVGLSSADAGRELWGLPPVPANVPKTRSKRAKAG